MHILLSNTFGFWLPTEYAFPAFPAFPALRPGRAPYLRMRNLAIKGKCSRGTRMPLNAVFLHTKERMMKFYCFSWLSCYAEITNSFTIIPVSLQPGHSNESISFVWLQIVSEFYAILWQTAIEKPWLHHHTIQGLKLNIPDIELKFRPSCVCDNCSQIIQTFRCLSRSLAIKFQSI